MYGKIPGARQTTRLMTEYQPTRRLATCDKMQAAYWRQLASVQQSASFRVSWRQFASIGVILCQMLSFGVSQRQEVSVCQSASFIVRWCKLASICVGLFQFASVGVSQCQLVSVGINLCQSCVSRRQSASVGVSLSVGVSCCQSVSV